MIRKSGNRFFLGTNAKRLPGDHAPGKERDHDPIQSDHDRMIGEGQGTV
jgi:hypothetical protein